MKLIFTGCSSKRTCFNVLDPDRVFQLNLDRSNGTISFALIEAELLQSKIWRLAKKRSGELWGNGNFNRNDGGHTTSKTSSSDSSDEESTDNFVVKTAKKTLSSYQKRKVLIFEALCNDNQISRGHI